MTALPRTLLCTLALLASSATLAQSVALSGVMGNKALLIVDGGAPKSVTVGESYQGVRVVSAQGQQAVVDIAGVRQTLQMGAAPSSVSGGAAPEGGSRIVLQAGDYGHFHSAGQINGRMVNFVVDTGASMIGIGQADADAIGLKYQSGERVPMSTANGHALGWRLSLQSVRIGDVMVRNVDAVVSPGSMPYVLLGNSFLSRFQMSRINDQMFLDRRY